MHLQKHKQKAWICKMLTYVNINQQILKSLTFYQVWSINSSIQLKLSKFEKDVGETALDFT